MKDKSKNKRFEAQIFVRLMLACKYARYRPGFQKFSIFPDDQKPQPSICFKTSGQDFQTFRQTIG